MSETTSTLIARAALWLLVAFSIATWALIVLKAMQAWSSARADRREARRFAESDRREAAALLQQAGTGNPHGPDALQGPMKRVAAALAIALTAAQTAQAADRRELAERALERQIRRERRRAERGLAVLASIGSTAPFVGLFGTVFGIIHALEAISHRAQAGIDVVAGPIGEALIATGVGIAVAVPAVLAYNFFLRRSRALNADLDEFANDLLALAIHAHDSGPLHGVPPAVHCTAREALA